MIIPVRCFSCGKVVGDKWEPFSKRVAAGEPPKEVLDAWRAGATMVKVFPANLFGPAYFKDLSGPFTDIPLLACGGVTLKNIGAFFANGAGAASFGGSIFKREWLRSGDFKSVGHALKTLIRATDKAKPNVPRGLIPP